MIELVCLFNCGQLSMCGNDYDYEEQDYVGGGGDDDDDGDDRGNDETTATIMMTTVIVTIMTSVITGLNIASVMIIFIEGR